MRFNKKIISWIRHHELHTQLARFLVVGGISTVISYSVFIFSLRFLDLNYIISNILGFIAGISFGYPVNKRWTFDKGLHKNSYFAQYMMIYLISLLISIIFLRIAVDFFGIIPEIANIMAIFITTCTNFAGTKFLVFRK